MTVQTYSALQTAFADNTSGAITASNMRDFVDTCFQSTAMISWGNITGTIGNQTDLTTTLSGYALLSGATFTGVLSNSRSGAASASSVTLTGAIFTGGTGTTTFPLMFIQPTGTTAYTAWNTNGTYLGFNVPTFNGHVVNIVVNGATRFSIDGAGNTNIAARATASALTVSGANGSFSGSGSASTAVIAFTGTLLSGGTGTTNFPHLLIQPTGTTAVTTWSTSGTHLGINAASGFAGNFLDFNIAGSNVMTISSAGQFLITGNIRSSGGSLQAATAGQINWASATRMICPSDGLLQLTNSATTGFTRLQFGGTTSSFPALKVSGTTLIARLADDSADTTLQMKNLIVSSSTTPASSSATGTTGTIAWDSGFIYVCTATNTWVRAALTTW